MRLHIMLAEDDPQKRAAVLTLLQECGVDLDHVVQANDLRTAAKHLGRSRFDVLILDIAMPRDPGRDLEPNAGLDLLRDLHERNDLLIPRRIVGLSGYEDVLEQASEEFETYGCVFVRYNSGHASWKAPLRSVVNGARRLLSAGEQDFRSHAFVLCALREPELSAVLANGWAWNRHVVPGDNTNYYRAELSGDRIVFAAAASRMGTEATVALAGKAIEHFRPKYLTMSGIAAGVANRTHLGDVIVADPVWNWASGKWQLVNEVRTFALDPHQIQLDERVRAATEAIAQDTAWLATTKAAFQGLRPGWEQRVLTGPLASGPAVLADGSGIATVQNQQHRKLLGIDMEAYGVFVAAQQATQRQPIPVVVKAVVDHGDSLKGDDHQSFGAYMSAKVLRKLVDSLG